MKEIICQKSRLNSFSLIADFHLIGSSKTEIIFHLTGYPIHLIQPLIKIYQQNPSLLLRIDRGEISIEEGVKLIRSANLSEWEKETQQLKNPSKIEYLILKYLRQRNIPVSTKEILNFLLQFNFPGLSDRSLYDTLRRIISILKGKNIYEFSYKGWISINECPIKVVEDLELIIENWKRMEDIILSQRTKNTLATYL